MNLLNNQLLHPFDRVFIFKAEVELGRANRFVCGVVPDLKVGVVQGLLTSDSFRRIEVKHSGQEINGKRIGVGDEGRERNAGLDGERADILLSTGRTNTAKGVLGRGSQIVQDLVELINVAGRSEYSIDHEGIRACSLSALEDRLSEE